MKKVFFLIVCAFLFSLKVFKKSVFAIEKFAIEKENFYKPRSIKHLTIIPSKFIGTSNPFEKKVISEKEIEEVLPQTSKTLLCEVSDFPVFSLGEAGGLISIFPQGLSGKYNVLFIDGIRVFDPTGTDNNDNRWILTVLSPSVFTQVDILKGPQSVEYGPQAIGGVVNLESLPEKSRIFAWAEYGSYRTFYRGFKLELNRNNTRGFLGFSENSIKDFSKKETEPDKDPFYALNFNFKMEKELSYNLKLGGSFFHLNSNQDLDGWEQKEENKLDFFDVYLKKKTLIYRNFLESEIKYGNTFTKRVYDGRDRYEGRLEEVKLLNSLKLKKIKISLGGEYKSSRGKFDTQWENLEKKIEGNALFLSGEYASSVVNLQAGIRREKEEKRNALYPWEAKIILFPEKKISFFAKYSEGVSFPSIYQLYSSYGNPDLEIEKSYSWEAGFGINLLNKKEKKTKFYGKFFSHKIKDMIGWDYVNWKYKNIKKAIIEGAEGGFESKRGGIFLNLEGAYFFTFKDEKDEPLLRRPKYQIYGKTGYSSSRFYLDLIGKYVGPYKDRDSQGNFVDMGDFFVVNLYSGITFKRHFILYFKVINLFNRKYQEIYGYNTYERSFFGGVKIVL